jgi:hypothetical protein
LIQQLKCWFGGGDEIRAFSDHTINIEKAGEVRLCEKKRDGQNKARMVNV